MVNHDSNTLYQLSELCLYLYTSQNKFCISYKQLNSFKIENNLHLEQHVYILTTT